ncbi:GDSL esterase/lipase At5g55050 [Cynara cardunculus var. scolymus]|uniref:GDSL esterase/lipase At5g55050 n=1 Tax=Cynara cardunculus var. scolymus TaxID=59895 RepID=UPI000D62D10C|nr:GDSL esterase/lipase At5g55050 [Cynara cardunculus var. scolymus]
MTTSINGPPLSFIVSFFLCAVIFRSGVVLCESVPGLYIFGDSLVDVGNNNYLALSLAKANFPHNGVDFPTGKATGRFSNGKNAADFLAEKVGLPSAPAYLSLVSKSKKLSSSNATVTGISFASGGAGIFNGTDELFKQSIPLTKQVEFYSLVHDQLVQQLGAAAAQTHLSKSLFLIIIGSNDLFGYFNKDSNVSKQYTPQQYVDLMVSTLKSLIKKMHGLGARKFVVSGVGVIGCCPAQRKQNNTECKAEANYWSKKYNDGLQALLRELKSELSDINYSYFHLYDAMNGVIQHPQNYGITEIKAACCGLGNLKADIPCIPVSTFCTNRKNHLFWDLYHPTETASGIFAGIIYGGSPQFTNPMNVEQLVKA